MDQLVMRLELLRLALQNQPPCPDPKTIVDAAQRYWEWLTYQKAKPAARRVKAKK